MIQNHISQPFIIIGMHRSGTTLLAETLNRSGICMGIFRDHNGEAMHFLSLNQQMLWAEGASWLDPKEPSQINRKTLPENIIYAEHIKSTSSNPLRLRLIHNKPWGWKDPRNTFTLKHWLNEFPAAKVINVVRDGRAVAMSLQARNRVVGEVHNEKLDDLKFNFELWEKYVEIGLSHQNNLGQQCITIKYESLITRDKETLNKLNAFTKVNVADKLQIKAARNAEFPEQLNQLARDSKVFQNLGYHI